MIIPKMIWPDLTIKIYPKKNFSILKFGKNLVISGIFLIFQKHLGYLKPKNHSIFLILKNIHPKKHTSKAQCVFFSVLACC
jgi:hypothetical protein